MPIEKVINMLTNVQTAEVSLVRRGANNKRIAFTKSKELPTMKIQELLKTVLETEAEGEAALVETLKSSGADSEAIEVAVANFRLQSGFKDKLSKEEFASVAKAAGFDVAKAKKMPEDEMKEEDEDDGEGFPFKGKKKKTAKSHVPEGMPVEMRKAWDEQQATIERLEKAAENSAKQVETLRKDAERKEYIAKCETSFAHVPGMSSEEMGEMLQKAYEVSEDFGKQLEKQWGDTQEALKKSALFENQGTAHSSHGSDAMAKMESLAKEYIAKDSSLTQATALDRVMREHPELYNEYLGENPAQRGR